MLDAADAPRGFVQRHDVVGGAVADQRGRRGAEQGLERRQQDGLVDRPAHLLRRRYGYKGEVRATGQVLRDQLRLMIRSGFDAMIIDQADAEAVYDISAHEFSEFYQAASDTSDTIFMKRQKKREEKAAQ